MIKQKAMNNIKILWADDEIELLKPHIIFLENKGYSVVAVNDGSSAIEKVSEDHFDIVFLDEQMPGISGLDALSEIKTLKPSLPIIMITKSEAEDLMEAAIGSKINDYLIKPVNPNQILLTIKKNLDRNDLVTQNTTMKYQSEFSQLAMQIGNAQDWNDWVDVYKKLTYWESQLEISKDRGMDEILSMQKNDANLNFGKFIKLNYQDWLRVDSEDKPLLSPSIIKEKVIPHLKNDTQTLLLVIDNLRYDHWLSICPLLQEYFTVESDDVYCSILPTDTQYARNAIFAGLMPSEIKKLYPKYWVTDEEDEGKNQYEKQLLEAQLKRFGIQEKFFFEKITAVNPGKKITDKLNQIMEHKFSVIVYNFIDKLSHSRTEMDMLKELANNEPAYKSLVLSWFKHSVLFELLKELSIKNIKIIITTDHGSIRVQNPIKVIGDKNITTNLRYKQGKSLQYNPKEVFEIHKPEEIHLPATHLSSKYIFTLEQDFFAYPNNFNHYVKYYKDSFQHGGISIEEMIIPCAVLQSK